MSNSKKPSNIYGCSGSFRLTGCMWARSLITYFRHIYNSSNVSGKLWLGGKKGGSKWSYMPFPVLGHILFWRDVFVRSFTPFLIHSCIKPGLLTRALGTAGKRRLSGLSATPWKRRKGEIIQGDAIWTSWGVSHLSEGNKLKSQFAVILSLILFWKWILKLCTWSISQLTSAHNKYPAWWLTPSSL